MKDQSKSFGNQESTKDAEKNIRSTEDVSGSFAMQRRNFSLPRQHAKKKGSDVAEDGTVDAEVVVSQENDDGKNKCCFGRKKKDTQDIDLS